MGTREIEDMDTIRENKLMVWGLMEMVEHGSVRKIGG